MSTRATAAASVVPLLLFSALPAAADGPEPAGARGPDSLPRLLVLTTGGTIASRPDAPSLSGDELVAAVPEVVRHARLRVEELFRIGSSAMTPRNWLGLARRIREGFAPDARGKGTLVVLNGEIHSARSVRKMDNLRLDAFESPGPGALGVADPDTVVFYRSPVRKHGDGGAFAGPLPGSLPAVPVVLDFTGFDGSTIRDWRERGSEGIVVAAFAGGRMSPAAGNEALAAGAAGIPVVVSSRVPGGRVPDGTIEGPDGPGPMVRAGLIAAGDLPPWKARVLLMLSLTRTREPVEIRRIFRTH